MLFRCWCQNDTALKMSGTARGVRSFVRRAARGGRALRLRTARRALPPAARQSAAVTRVG